MHGYVDLLRIIVIIITKIKRIQLFEGQLIKREATMDSSLGKKRT